MIINGILQLIDCGPIASNPSHQGSGAAGDAHEVTHAG